MVIIVPLTVRRLALLHYLFTPHYVGAELELSTHILYADERFLSQCNRARFIESRFGVFGTERCQIFGRSPLVSFPREESLYRFAVPLLLRPLPSDDSDVRILSNFADRRVSEASIDRRWTERDGQVTA